MTTTSGLRRWRGNLRRLSGRTPLRVKMITALLALVIMALAIISVASLTVFRNYRPGPTSRSPTCTSESTGLHDRARPAEPGYCTSRPVRWSPDRAERCSTPRARPRTSPAMPSDRTCRCPNVPTARRWLKAHCRPADQRSPRLSGSDNWQVITRQIRGAGLQQRSGPVGRPGDASSWSSGVNLGDINQTLAGWPGSTCSSARSSSSALAIVGVAIVRASLRPLSDIERTAQAIAAGDLSRRVPDQDPVTEVGRLGRSLNTMLSPDRVVVLRPGPVRGGRAALGGADAPVRRGRQPRAAHAAHRDARLRRVLPAAGRDARRSSRPQPAWLTARSVTTSAATAS